MRTHTVVISAAILALWSCQTPAAYRFQLNGAPDNASEDQDVKVSMALDPTVARGISLSVTNKTDQVLQVNWRQVTVTDPQGAVTMPRPEVDLGWVQPGATAMAELTPFSLPSGGAAAHAYQGRRFELQVPMIVHGEPKTYSYSLVATVSDLVTEKK